MVSPSDMPQLYSSPPLRTPTFVGFFGKPFGHGFRGFHGQTRKVNLKKSV
jgi:hypothetical protein